MAYPAPTSFVSAEFEKFMPDMKKRAAYMSSEFQRKKQAFQYARARENTTGKLDVNKLAQYRTRDDIFKSTTVVADAQSHGLVLIVDQSSSMYKVRKAVVQRIIELSEFCRLSGIPFVVYTFASIGSVKSYKSERVESINTSCMTFVEVLNSDLKKNEYLEAIYDLWIASYSYDTTVHDQMGGTPLLESLVISHDVCADFKRKHGIQKLNIIVISDGDGSPLTISSPGDSYRSNYARELRLNLLKTPTVLPTAYHECYEALVRSLREKLDATVVCFYLTPGNRDKKVQKAKIEFKDDDVVVIPEHKGYTQMLFIKVDALEGYEDDNLDDILARKATVKSSKGSELSAADIRRAFVSSHASRSGRNIFAQKFTEIIS